MTPGQRVAAVLCGAALLIAGMSVAGFVLAAHAATCTM